TASREHDLGRHLAGWLVGDVGRVLGAVEVLGLLDARAERCLVLAVRDGGNRGGHDAPPAGTRSTGAYFTSAADPGTVTPSVVRHVECRLCGMCPTLIATD